jgi:hypothetical protein
MKTGEIVGEFCGSPIRSYNLLELELEDDFDRQDIVHLSILFNSKNTAEVLPGELICSDNITRRYTADKQRLTTMFNDALYIYSRSESPNDGYCFVYHNDGTVSRESFLGNSVVSHQSTPEELCACLNGIFKHEVLTEGNDKVLTAKNKQGELVYSFRYVGGLPRDYSDTSVVEEFVAPSKLVLREPVETKEWWDEYSNDYVPTSSVTRSTIGGTALFEDGFPDVQCEPKPSTETKCEWYPDHENRCGKTVTHAGDKSLASVCDECFALREARTKEEQ